MNVTQLQQAIEAQKRTINALQNENRWLQDVIFNPSFNEIDMRLLVKNTPREMRMGLCTEFPEKKIYLPDQAEAAHCSPKVASQHLRTLKNTGAFSYRAERDNETGNTRVLLQPKPAAETPAQLEYERAKRGGSTWEDGKRIKRCKDCGSANLARVSQIICVDCGSAQTEKSYRPVNDIPDSQYDTDPTEQQEQETTRDPDCHIDTDPLPDEIPNLPPSLVNTRCSDGSALPPPELRALPIWCPWRYEPHKDKQGNLVPGAKLDKVPYQTSGRVPQRAKSNDATTWSTYEQAQVMVEEYRREGYPKPFDGIGFMCDGSFTGIDLDHCRNKETGEISDQALEIVARFASYTYITPSREGLRIVIRAKKPGERCKKGDIELYDQVRFFTWTPERLDGTPEMVEDGQKELDAFYREVWPEENITPIRSTPPHFPCSRSDEEILEKARNARNDSGARFRSLYDEGDISGYSSQSEADLALCGSLIYWADGNVSTIDRLFRASRLMREKWERSDYREGTINLAIESWQRQQQERRAS